MKKLTLSFAAIVAMAVLFERCATEDQEAYTPEKIQFSFSLPEDVSAEEKLPADAFVLLSLKDQHGEIVFSQQRIKINAQGNRYITDPVDLRPGNYDITDFIIVNAADEELYAAPKQGSVFHHSISVSRKVSTIEMRVEGTTKRLRTFVIGTRHYELFYNKRGDVDSLVATDLTFRYVYRVAYTNGRIDSVQTIDSGLPVSVHDDFVYDNRGNILSYNYYMRVEGAPWDLPFPTTISYDNRGRFQNINGSEFIYDNHNNVISGFDATFTYDKGLNPFYKIDNLFAIVIEEPAYWPLMFSRNNTATQTFPDGVTVNHLNEYDSRNRVIVKSGVPLTYY